MKNENTIILQEMTRNMPQPENQEKTADRNVIRLILSVEIEMAARNRKVAVTKER